MLSDYADVFADHLEDLGKTDKMQHTIDTKDTPPVR